MDTFCRSCLIKFQDSSELVGFSERRRRLFIYITGIQVKYNDSIKFQVCKECHQKLKAACEFKKQARTSDKLLKNYFALRDSGDVVDLCTYLKNNDESLTFRLMNAGSTPLNQKGKEDDNVSNCTSIRNFISDIMRDGEILDADARIAQEVLQEEADILDDSLDSHWLHEDRSLNNDSRLDFSFSLFSTPRSIDNVGSFTPNLSTQTILNEPLVNFPHFFPKKENELETFGNATTTTEANDLTKPESQKENQENTFILNESLGKNFPEYLVKEKGEKETFEDVVPANTEADVRTEGVDYQGDLTCSINRNLERVLSDMRLRECPLEDVLASPPVLSGFKTPLTPIIENILFGDKLAEDLNFDASKTQNSATGFSENSVNEVIWEQFLNEGTTKQKSPPRRKGKNIDNVWKEYLSIDLDDNVQECSCKICDKRCKNAKGLRIHFSKYHGIKIPNEVNRRKIYSQMLRICDYCGKEYRDAGNFVRHVQMHMKTSENKRVEHKCDICKLTFTAKHKLAVHMMTHGIHIKETKAKRDKTPGSNENSSSHTNDITVDADDNVTDNSIDNVTDRSASPQLFSTVLIEETFEHVLDDEVDNSLLDDSDPLNLQSFSNSEKNVVVVNEQINSLAETASDFDASCELKIECTTTSQSIDQLTDNQWSA